MGGGMNIEFTLRAAGASDRDPSGPMRVLVFGDFSGRGIRGATSEGPAITQRPIRKLDVDTLDSLVEDFGASVDVALPSGDKLHVGMTEFDDLHPDSLWRNIPLFTAIRDLRKRLKDPATFAAAAAELGLSKGGDPSSVTEPKPPAGSGGASSLSDLLGGEVKSSQDAPSAAVDRMIKGLVGGSGDTRRAADPRLDECLLALESTASEAMRAILHDPGFRSLESVWRAAHMLCTMIEADEESLQIRLIDMSLEELRGDLQRAEPEVLVRIKREIDDIDGGAFTFALGLYQLDASESHAEFAARLGAMGAAIGAPVITGGPLELAGCADIARAPDARDWQEGIAGDAAGAWTEARKSTHASWIGLSSPRLVMRQPYGRHTEPVDGLEFEEIDPDSLGGVDAGAGYLWGPGAVAAACVLGQAFTMGGRRGLSVGSAELLGVPLHAFKTSSGEKGAQSPCEAWFGESTSERISASGLITVAPVQGRDAVRVGPIKSLGGGELSGLS